MPGVVNGRGRMIAAADQRKLVGMLGHAREDLGDLDPGSVGLDRLEGAADLGRRFGFMSQQSIWLGAPRLKIMITDRSSWPSATPPRALAAISSGSDSPMADSVPACRNSRRVDTIAGMRCCFTDEVEHRSFPSEGMGGTAGKTIRLAAKRRDLDRIMRVIKEQLFRVARQENCKVTFRG